MTGISDVRSDLPQTLGVCSICWGEFSVPDAKPGDTCPNGPHWVDGQDEPVDPPMIVFVRVAEVERLREERDDRLDQFRRADREADILRAEVERLREGWDTEVDWANRLLRERDWFRQRWADAKGCDIGAAQFACDQAMRAPDITVQREEDR